MKRMNSKKGFTLIELLIVIAIIAILAVAFLPTLLNAPAKGRDTARIANLNSIQKALIYDSLTNSTNPPSDAAAKTGGCADTIITSTTAIANMGGAVPKDPSATRTLTGGEATITACANSGKYFYKAAPSGSYIYGLYAVMENSSTNTVKCSKAFTGVKEAYTTVDADLCYAILAQ
jgi:prepilin-type N-terminal cleavage/methylation domain-containing protein